VSEVNILIILVVLLMLLVLAVANYTLTLREMIFRLDRKLAEHLHHHRDYTRVSRRSRDLAKRIGVDLGVRTKDSSE
jgi:predicted Holliday junction resolvase-like endonuclease